MNLLYAFWQQLWNRYEFNLFHLLFDSENKITNVVGVILKIPYPF